MTSICGGSFATKTQGDCCQDRALPTSIMTNDEIDEWAKGHVEMRMAHEIFTDDRLDDSIVGSSILFRL